MKTLLHNSLIWLALMLVIGCGSSESSDTEPADVTDPTTTQETDDPTTDDTTTDDETDDSTTVEDLALAGKYVDSWGTEHEISNDVWLQGSSAYHISTYDNETGTIIAQNDASNAYNPDLWSRFDWAYVADKLWYCQTAYAAESEEAALATEAADATNPAEEGCGGFSWTQLNEALEIRGEYGDSWGGEHTITQTTWESGSSTYAISQFDNEEQFIIAQNGEENAYNPSLWSRFDWAKVDGKLWYCQTAYAAESEEAALATAAADATDPSEGGCGGFSWTQLVDALEIRGEYGDSWGGEHTITQTTWVSGSSSYAISQFDNDEQFIIAQNGEENAYNPGLWSRFDWAKVDGNLWYCQTAYAAESEEAALATEAANATNPAEEGCGGFSWTQLVDALEIRGDYGDSWGGEHTITQTAWVSGSSSYAISQFDNELQFIIAQNGEDNAYNPGLWSRFDWASVDGALWYCQTAYAAESEEAALATAAADATDPSEGGCGGFSWTQLVDGLDIRGSFGDSWGGEHTITQTTWVTGGSSYAISQFDNDEQFIIAQNGEDNAYNPGLWSRFDWASVDGALWYCQTAYAAESEEAALATEAADATNPSDGGCGGFSWTQLTTTAE